MLKYIITWIVLTVQPTTCPEMSRNSDLGIQNNPMVTCAVYHTKTVKEKHQKIFTSRDSAQVFLSRLKEFSINESTPRVTSGVVQIKLDSICEEK